MTEILNYLNGKSLYLLYKLLDFEKIFCVADHDSIYFICVNDQSNIRISFYPVITHYFFETDTKDKWMYSYVFDSKDIKRSILWFKNRSNANLDQNLVFEFADDNIKIDNKFVNTKLETIIQNPDIPIIPEMKNGVSARIKNIKEMKSQISSISEEVIQVTLTESELIISGKQSIFPRYPIKVSDTKLNNDLMKYKTLCYKHILEISCELAYEANILSPELRFYPGGATQLYGKKNEILFRSLLVAVK
ncbi:MAG TPA: hypothetical protein C5S37_04885 [Methanophagales archaeon]|nr:hypothetical protein [Methanophagales archaeon]